MWMLEFLERLIPPSNRKLRVDYIEPWISGSGPPECECIRNHFHPRTAFDTEFCWYLHVRNRGNLTTANFAYKTELTLTCLLL